MLPFSDACERNKLPILNVLRKHFVDRLQVLEIGSGTGQHAVFLAAHLPHLVWYPTEQQSSLVTLSERIRIEGGPNVRPAQMLDAGLTPWSIHSVDAVFTANTLHIMSWQNVESLFRGFLSVLQPGGVVCIYGPFRYAGRYTSPSNEEFDQALKQREPASGIRDVSDLTALADTVGLHLDADHDLPAFNRLLVFVRENR